MRTLIVGALAATMAGCSSRMPPRANLVSDVNGVTCPATAAARPLELVPASYKTPSAIVKIHAGTAAKRKRPSSARLPPSPASPKPPPRPHTTPPPIPVRRKPESPIHIPEAAPSRAPRPSRSNNRSRPRRQSPNESRRRRPLQLRPANPIPGGPGHGAPGDQVGRRSQRKNHCDRRPAGCIHEQGLDRDGGRGGGALPMSEDQAKPVDRLIDGEVPAAVLTLVSAEAAGSFPDIAEYQILRIPLSPRSIDTRQDKP